MNIIVTILLVLAGFIASAFGYCAFYEEGTLCEAGNNN
jgi:hypothetical protein